MKHIGILIASIGVFVVLVMNLYYNSVTLDIQNIKDYVVETNIILEDISKKEEYVMDKKDEYISRLTTLKKGMENTKTTFLINDYKLYKIKSIESLIKSISEDKNKDRHLEDVNKYNALCDKELEKLTSRNLIG